MDLERAHKVARERGVSLWLYEAIRPVLRALLHIFYRFEINGAENVPATGAVIITPNHKSFFDTFFVGVAVNRPVRYMAKSELILSPLGRLFVRLGAFPVERGHSDRNATASAKLLIAQEEVVVVFPEGTRVEQSDALGRPHHGAGVIALETGTPIVPAAVTGTEHLLRGLIPKLHRVQVTLLPPVMPEAAKDTEDPVEEIVDRRVWPAISNEYTRLRQKPGPALAALAALGIGAGVVARHRANVRTRQLGTIPPKKTRRQAKRKKMLGRGRH